MQNNNGSLFEMTLTYKAMSKYRKVNWEYLLEKSMYYDSYQSDDFIHTFPFSLYFRGLNSEYKRKSQ